ncbi:hypothetical protein G6F59_015486 [Rhizopus arrhizus]|nr:hypothetical protein G6F59_015486 [Rhizopus arrhizus]
MAQVQLVQQHEVAALFQAEAHRDHRVAHHVSRLVQPQQHFAVARVGQQCIHAATHARIIEVDPVFGIELAHQRDQPFLVGAGGEAEIQRGGLHRCSFVFQAGREAPGEVIIRVRRGRPAVGPRPTPARPATAPCPVWSPPRYRPPRSWSSSRRCRRPWHRVPPGAPWRHRG